ncbi:MAG: tyrosine-type recombinase/integrase [Bacteroidales bacterium]|nr:tyrosine-type recombinase/integrase [Bacteroidales bacterium]
MINRGNWQLVKDYLKYREIYDQLSLKSLRLEKTWLHYLLEWADEKPFRDAPKIIPVFPEYVRNQESYKGSSFSREYQRKVISCAKSFFLWLTLHKAGYRHKINSIYLNTLKTVKGFGNPQVHEYVSLDEMMDIASAPVYSLRDRRIKAAAVFMFLSGIRIKAFTTLPIKAVDLNDLSVKQWPTMGVETKNKKSATTYLLKIDPLLEVIRDWDQFIRKHLSDNSFWFAHISPIDECLDQDNFFSGTHRDQRARKDLKEWMVKVGLPYHSPHKFRHGHAVYFMQRAKDLGDFKAISQNMMHSNLSITDGIYGMFSGEDIKKRITGLDHQPGGNISKEEFKRFLEKTLEQLKNQ